MNWTKDASIRLSKACTVAMGLLLAALCIVSPWSQLFSVTTALGGVTVNWYTVSLVAFAVPAYTALIQLYRLLNHLSRGEVFIADNVRCLRRISWCCFGAAAVFLASSLYSVSWTVLTVAALFGGLVLRVVKNVFAAAVDLQDDHDLTI